MRIDKPEYIQESEKIYLKSKDVIEKQFSDRGFQNYCCDGIINVDSYNGAKYKIAFVLSESYGKLRNDSSLAAFRICHGDVSLASRQLGLSNDKIKATRRISYLAYLILNNAADSKMQKYPSKISDSSLIILQDSLNSIVYLNVKKALRVWIPEKSSKQQSNREVIMHGEANCEILKSQLDLSKPEVVLVCGDAAYYGLRRGHVIPKLVRNTLIKDQGMYYFRVYHPSAPGKWSNKYMLELSEVIKNELRAIH